MSIKVLIIEDDVLIAQLLESSLLHHKFKVFVANSGLDGIEAVRQFNPNVILLDLMMPYVSGWEVCRTIRTFSQVPIMILSAVTDSDKVVRVLDEGANDYLVKPAPAGVLVSRLKKLAQNVHKGLETSINLN